VRARACVCARARVCLTGSTFNCFKCTTSIELKEFDETVIRSLGNWHFSVLFLICKRTIYPQSSCSTTSEQWDCESDLSNKTPTL